MSFSVLGVDLSLTATGINLNDGKPRQHRLIRTKPDEHLEVRKDRIVTSILRYAKRSRCSIVLLEKLNSGPKNHDNRPAQAMSVVTRELWLAGIPYDEVASNTVKLYATGNGRAEKPEMVEAAEALGVDLSAYAKSLRHNVADAIWVAAWGYSHRDTLSVI
jgi:Holliday junction resolvasome RuvABC endonuclease subunit